MWGWGWDGGGGSGVKGGGCGSRVGRAGGAGVTVDGEGWGGGGLGCTGCTWLHGSGMHCTTRRALALDRSTPLVIGTRAPTPAVYLAAHFSVPSLHRPPPRSLYCIWVWFSLGWNLQPPPPPPGPSHLVQVLAAGGVQRVLEHLHLLYDRQVVVVGRHAQHQTVLPVERDLAGLPAGGGVTFMISQDR